MGFFGGVIGGCIAVVPDTYPMGGGLTVSWQKGSNEPDLPAQIWYWRYQTHAYGLLEEIDGYPMELWAIDKDR